MSTRARSMTTLDRPSLFESPTDASGPLAHRMRPAVLEDFLGQAHLLGPGKPLREAIERGELTSIVLWGPPGCGKTTLARLVAKYTDRAFEIFSAVTEGVPRVREIIAQARERRDMHGRGTILFCDEIHRFNKAQQDAFLPSVEEGVITLIGATTENPSFELNSALLSRMRVFVLEPLGEDALMAILGKAWQALQSESGIELGLGDDALALLVRYADGDARRGLNAAEAVWEHHTHGSRKSAAVTAEDIAATLDRRMPRYDKHGDEHFNLISALHKAVRGSDVEGALYWLARMIEGGEDVNYIVRRIVRMAAEDIGLADPRALSIALAAKDAYAFLGSPEGELAVVEALIFLATAPKSNSAYVAWGEALRAAREHPNEPVPLHIRNAPTKLMRDIGYGEGYRYDHSEGGHAAGQTYLPPSLEGAHWYEPTNSGFEKNIAERLKWWAEQRKTKNE